MVIEYLAAWWAARRAERRHRLRLARTQQLADDYRDIRIHHLTRRCGQPETACDCHERMAAIRKEQRRG